MKNTKIRKVIVLPDTHLPFEDKLTMQAVEKYIADNTWDEWIQMGDLMDFDFISSFNQDALRKIEGRRYDKDYAYANEFLDRHQALVRKNNRNAKFTLLEGNHEQRVERVIDKTPSLEGKIEVGKCLDLNKRNINWIRSWSKGEMYNIGKAYFTHGWSLATHHAKKMVDAYGENIFYGHTHDIMSFPRTTKGRDNTKVGQSLGCLCKPQDYMRGNPDNWQQGFGVFYIMPNGFFTYYIIRIFKHTFVSPEGKVYKP